MKNKSLDIVKSRAFSSLLPFLVLVVLRHEGTPPFGILPCGCG